jgi:hypothetical protein
MVAKRKCKFHKSAFKMDNSMDKMVNGYDGHDEDEGEEELELCP